MNRKLAASPREAAWHPPWCCILLLVLYSYKASHMIKAGSVKMRHTTRNSMVAAKMKRKIRTWVRAAPTSVGRRSRGQERQQKPSGDRTGPARAVEQPEPASRLHSCRHACEFSTGAHSGQGQQLVGRPQSSGTSAAASSAAPAPAPAAAAAPRRQSMAPVYGEDQTALCRQSRPA